MIAELLDRALDAAARAGAGKTERPAAGAPRATAAAR